MNSSSNPSQSGREASPSVPPAENPSPAPTVRDQVAQPRGIQHANRAHQVHNPASGEPPPLRLVDSDDPNKDLNPSPKADENE